MDDQETISEEIDDFLTRERKKLSEEKSLLQKLLSQLIEQQNLLPANCPKENVSVENEISKQAPSCTQQNIILKEQNKIVESKKLVNENHAYRPTDYQYKHHGREVEKERLARIFETSPQFFNGVCKKYRYKKREENQHNQNSDSCFEKENVNPKYCTSARGTDGSDLIFISENWDRKDDNIRTMVRFGEFSPLNPDFRLSGKTFLGFGEYEEQRKIFLNKKKLEYQQYLIKAKNNRISKLTRSNSLPERRSTSDTDSETSSRPGSVVSQMPSQFRENLSPDRTRDFIKWQQQAYRTELDKQVEEKRKMKQEEEDKEKKECENCELQEMSQRKNLTKSIENEFQRRLNYYNNDEFRNRARESRQEQSAVPKEERSFASRHNEECDLVTEIDPRVTSRIKSPILKHNTEACAVENIEAYQKMKQELYRKELAKQIEENKRLEEERKAKELEMERKTEEKIQEEKEKLRREYEKEQADIAYRVYQKAELEKRLADNLYKIKKENDDKKKIKKRSSPKPISKMSTVYATGHKFNDTHATKNVSFLPHTFVYNIQTEALRERSSDESEKASDAVIIQAPYVLATKDISEYYGHKNTCTDLKRVENRSSSPILPAVRTKSILNSIHKPNDLVIPPGVSMSKEAKNHYIRDDKILSNLSEIRRKLLKNQPSTNTNKSKT